MTRKADFGKARACALGCSIAALVLGTAWAEEDPGALLPSGATKDFHGRQADLRYTGVDLVYSSGKVVGAADAVGSKSGKLGGSSNVVGGKVEELAMKETTTEVSIDLPGDILFDFDKWTLRPSATPVLARVAEVLRKYGKARVRIEGHTDAKGSHEYNSKLSRKRAEAVKAWLVTHGVVGGALVTKGFAETRPVAPNRNPDGSDNPDGRQKNRRVEIIIEKS